MSACILITSNTQATVQSTRTLRFSKSSKPCHVGIHWIALAEYSKMSTQVPGFQSFFRLFCIILNWPN